MATPKIIEIRAVFLGKNGSCGFRQGESYDLWMFYDSKGRIRISRRNMDATAIPYDTQKALEKNWKITH